MIVELWTYRSDVAVPPDLEGCEVDARDGKVGKIDEATNEIGGSFVVLDTGPWIFGRKVMIPAGRIGRIDLENRRVLVDLTKDEIKSSPEYDPDTFGSPEYRGRVGDYYGGITR